VRRALRWIKRLVLGALALAVVAVIAVVVAAHTAWGREQIRQQVAAALARSFPGGARIGRVEAARSACWCCATSSCATPTARRR
jgi:hypothetical protein